MTGVTVPASGIEQVRPEIEPRGQWTLVFHYDTGWDVCSLTRGGPGTCIPSCIMPRDEITIPGEDECKYLKKRADLLECLYKMASGGIVLAGTVEQNVVATPQLIASQIDALDAERRKAKGAGNGEG